MTATAIAAVPQPAPAGKNTFSVQIECTSPAFGSGPIADRAELAKILTILVDDIERMKLQKNGTLSLRDGDGVVVGVAIMQGE